MYIYEIIQRSNKRPYVGMWYFRTFLEANRKVEELAYAMTFLYKKDGLWYCQHGGDLHTLEVIGHERVKITI